MVKNSDFEGVMVFVTGTFEISFAWTTVCSECDSHISHLLRSKFKTYLIWTCHSPFIFFFCMQLQSRAGSVLPASWITKHQLRKMAKKPIWWQIRTRLEKLPQIHVHNVRIGPRTAKLWKTANLWTGPQMAPLSKSRKRPFGAWL